MLLSEDFHMAHDLIEKFIVIFFDNTFENSEAGFEGDEGGEGGEVVIDRNDDFGENAAEHTDSHDPSYPSSVFQTSLKTKSN